MYFLHFYIEVNFDRKWKVNMINTVPNVCLQKKKLKVYEENLKSYALNIEVDSYNLTKEFTST
jgi:hypothetical protein